MLKPIAAMGILRTSTLLALALAGCAPSGAPYLHDSGARRRALIASLFDPTDGYARLRLSRYATGGGWDELAEWNPRVEPVALADLGGDLERPLSAAAAPLDLDVDTNSDESASLIALGEAAFFRYPVEWAPAAQLALGSTESASRYGFWLDGARGAGGVVRAALADGKAGLAYSCSTCHAAVRDGALAIGLGNDRLDLGRLAADFYQLDGASPALAWGPGRLDVSSSTGLEPARLADLRPVLWLTHLQQDATVEQHDLVSLAIRLETLIITSHAEAVRPPRAITLALAAWVWSLAATVEPRAPSSAAELRGASLFAARCAGCHAPPSFTGAPVTLAEIGTDPALGRSPDRGTGYYRVPSLRGVAARGLLLHDGALDNLAALFDPARAAPDYAGGVRAGPVAGHPFGLELDDGARAALVAFLQTL